jgi:EAL domain-containing protein (putative c-di-GMP-specific phosphodiesterase class I)
VRISIDDFGTGYSSLSYLHRLPVDYLKVDRSFVAQAPAGQPNHPIVATIMALGSQLGLDTVAEGVETPQQLEHLRSLGYTLGQGYLFSRPLPPDQITDLLTRQPPLSKARF